MTLQESIDSRTSFKNEAAVVGVLSVNADKTAKDGRKYHICEITDGFSKHNLFCWCEVAPRTGQFIKFVGETVADNKTNKSFFSVKGFEEAQDEEISDALRKVAFRFTVDVLSFQKDVREWANQMVEDKGLLYVINRITETSFLQKFEDAPAAKGAHHFLKGGLLKHTWEIFRMYKGLVLSQSDDNDLDFGELDHGVMTIAILMHDMYKILEYQDDGNGNFQLTENAVLLGHIFLGANFLQTLFASAKEQGFTIVPRTKNLVTHAILAHHGKLEWGSPVAPATKEAVLLHYLDQISAKFQMVDNTNNLEKNMYLGGYVIK